MAAVHRESRIKNKEESSLQKKASLTVESAVVLPFFFLAMVVIATMVDLYRISVLLQTALCEGAKELGMYAYCGPEDDSSPVGMVDDAICMAYGTKKIRECLKDQNVIGIKGGLNGIVLLGSKYENSMILLKSTFFYQCPVALFSMLPVKIEIQGQARAWTGYQGENYGREGQNDELVYITSWESVYHTSENCSYLNLSVQRVSRERAFGGVNVYGESYAACQTCVRNGSVNAQVYITQSGTAYHNDSRCPGLTRHVSIVKKSETDAANACHRCGN